MDNCVLRIEKCENGFEVEISDPAIVDANANPKSNYTDPWVGYVFATSAEVVKFIELHLDSLKPEPEEDDEEAYGAEFARQASSLEKE